MESESKLNLIHLRILKNLTSISALDILTARGKIHSFGSEIMFIRSLMRGITPALVVALCYGCLINSSKEKIIEPDAPRMTINFESETAMQMFQKKVSEHYEAGDGVQSRSDFGIPFVIGTSETKVLSENAFYNAQVKKTDVNGDGTITQAEARVYSEL